MEGKKLYNIDFVFCIDASSRMALYVEKIKADVLQLLEDYLKELNYLYLKPGKAQAYVRARLIVFRSYQESMSDLKSPMLVTDFYSFPEQQERFEHSLRSITAEGDGRCSDGLDALSVAIRSKWAPDNQGNRRRQIIVIWSNAGTNSLGSGKDADGYLQSLAKDFQELSQWWGLAEQSTDAFMDWHAKRLLIFAPEENEWSRISEEWPNVIHIPSVNGSLLSDQDYHEILRLLVARI